MGMGFVISDRHMIHLKSILKTITEARLIFESPLKISALNISQFEDPDNNFAYTTILKEKAKIIDKYDNYDIYQFIIKNQVFDVVVDKEFTVAYFNYDIKDNFMVERKVWQDPLHISLCRKMLFEYYLKKFRGIISDGTHSFLGERYWNKLLKQAMDSGYKTYVLKDETEKIPLKSVEDIGKYFLYGSEGLRYRFMIENATSS